VSGVSRENPPATFAAWDFSRSGSGSAKAQVRYRSRNVRRYTIKNAEVAPVRNENEFH
jgi:hypothetical protein